MNWPNPNPAMACGAGSVQPGAADGISPFLFPREMERPTSGRVGFTVFLLATAALLIRPSDLFPLLQDIPIYQTLVLACMSVSLSRLLFQLSPMAPARGVTQLVFAILAAVIMSHLARGSLYDVRTGGFEFFKICIYYLLVVAWVDTPARMRYYLLCLCGCLLIVTVLALCDYQGWIDLPSLRSVAQTDVDPATGATSLLRRLCGVGIVNDPNDLCLVLVAGAMMCLGFVGNRRYGRLRIGWLIVAGLFAYAITLTSSRGGFVSLLATIGAFLVVRYGGGRAMVVTLILVPTLLMLFAGRQTRMDLSDPDDTFRTRLDLWSDSMTLFEQSPIFGWGQDQQMELRGQVAHNSFVQSFAELGFFGGACFLGVFVLSLRGVYRTDTAHSDPELARMRPYVMGIIAGYAVGLLALSRGYTASTYVVLGIAAAYINLTPRSLPLRIDRHFARRMSGVSVLFIVGTYVFVRVMRP